MIYVWIGYKKSRGAPQTNLTKKHQGKKSKDDSFPFLVPFKWIISQFRSLVKIAISPTNKKTTKRNHPTSGYEKSCLFLEVKCWFHLDDDKPFFKWWFVKQGMKHGGWTSRVWENMHQQKPSGNKYPSPTSGTKMPCMIFQPSPAWTDPQRHGMAKISGGFPCRKGEIDGKSWPICASSQAKNVCNTPPEISRFARKDGPLRKGDPFWKLSCWGSIR